MRGYKMQKLFNVFLLVRIQNN